MEHEENRDGPLYFIEKITSACVDKRFPVCLHEALLEMFGLAGTARFISVAQAGRFPVSFDQEPRSAPEVYEYYMGVWRHILGEDMVEMIEYKALRKMESLRCNSCVLLRVAKMRLGMKDEVYATLKS